MISQHNTAVHGWQRHAEYDKTTKELIYYYALHTINEGGIVFVQARLHLQQSKQTPKSKSFQVPLFHHHFA